MKLEEARRRIEEVLLANPDSYHYMYNTCRAARVRTRRFAQVMDAWLEDGTLVDGWDVPGPKGHRRRYYVLTYGGERKLRGSKVERDALRMIRELKDRPA